MPTAVGLASSVAIWAGSAQFAVLTLAGSASWLTIVATAIVINSRHVMYSAAMATRFRDQPRWFRWFGPYLLIDQVFALLTTADDLRGDAFRRYFLTIGAVFWVGWHIAVTVGFVFGSSVPDSWQLSVAAPIMFAGLVVMGLTRTPAAVAAVVAAIVCLGTLGLPNRLGLLVGATAGVIAGYLVESRTEDADR